MDCKRSAVRSRYSPPMKSKTNTRSPFKWSATCSFCFVRFQAFKQVLIKF
nr:MAG TPA: hypothetical protein [Caudoviricetes sp.]